MFENFKDKSLNEIIDNKLGDFCKTISSGDTTRRNKIVDNLWCFSGFSGGNGVSTLVRELAQMLKDKGLTVLVLDLNLNCPIHWISLGFTYKVHSKDIYDLALGTAELKDCILNGKISLLGSRGRSVIELNNLETMAVANNFDKLLDSLKVLYDVVLIDCPFGMFSNTLINTSLYKCDKAYMVWSDNYSNINNYTRVIDTFRLFGINLGKLRYIYNKRGSVYINEKVYKALGINNFISVLPYDKSVVECGLEGVSYIDKGSGTGENATAYYKGLLDLLKIILNEVGYDLDNSVLKDITSFLGIKEIKVKNKKGLFRGKKSKEEASNEVINDDVIDDVTNVVEEVEVDLEDDSDDDFEVTYE